MNKCSPILIRTCFLLILSVITRPSFADIRLPHILSDGVVLQRDTNVNLWGWAKPNERITIKLDRKEVIQTIAKNGAWSVTLKPQPAGGPRTLEFIGDNEVKVQDIFFGDVWIASGQSNMQTSMDRVKDRFPLEVAKANFPKIRMFTVPGKYDFNTPVLDLDGGTWQAINSDTILSQSAVAYFFAKHIHLDTQVPIGIINSSFGGSPAQAWMSEEALKAFPHYLDAIKDFRNEENLKSIIESDQKKSNKWYQNLNQNDEGLKPEKEWYSLGSDTSSWQTMTVPGFWEDNGLKPMNGVVWFKKEITLPAFAANKPARLMLGRIVDADVAYVNGTKVGEVSYQYPPRRYNIPENLLKAGKNTITVRITSNSGKGGFVSDKPYYLELGDLRIELGGAWQYKVGAVSDPIEPDRFNQYMQPLGRYNAMLSPLLPLSIKGVIWYQGESNTERSKEYYSLFPALIREWRKQFDQGNFPFIFVQLANFMESKPNPSESSWAETRDAQLKALSEPNTAMAVAIDVGEWNDIHPLDKETVGDRLALAAKSLAYDDKKVVYSGPIFDSLTTKHSKLILKFKHVGSGLTYHGTKLKGFAVKGKFGKYVWANAEIEGDTIIVWNDSIETPTNVRYAWADNPDTANLYNKEGLPASPFQASTQ